MPYVAEVQRLPKSMTPLAVEIPVVLRMLSDVEAKAELLRV